MTDDWGCGTSRQGMTQTVRIGCWGIRRDGTYCIQEPCATLTCAYGGSAVARILRRVFCRVRR